MQIEMSILFSTGIALLGVYATVRKITSENKQQIELRERSLAAERERQIERHIDLKKTMEYTLNTVQQTAVKIDCMDNKFEGLDRKVTVLEESSKSAHKRIDTIEKKCDNRHEMRVQHG